MRSFITASVLITGALAQSTQDYLKCAVRSYPPPKQAPPNQSQSAALSNADVSKFTDCTDKSAEDCLCSNKEALSSLNTSASACKDIDLSSLTSSLCKSDSDSESASAPARHASMPMQPALKRAVAPDAPEPRVVYVTETRTECSCKSTPVAERPAHVSQIPVDVPASSSMGAMVVATPSYSHGVLVGSSSVFGSQASATPSPSGVDPSGFSPFEGAAAPRVSVHGGVAAVGVAAVMAFMAAL